MGDQNKILLALSHLTNIILFRLLQLAQFFFQIFDRLLELVGLWSKLFQIKLKSYLEKILPLSGHLFKMILLAFLDLQKSLLLIMHSVQLEVLMVDGIPQLDDSN